MSSIKGMKLVADEKMDCINQLDYYRHWRNLGHVCEAPQHN